MRNHFFSSSSITVLQLFIADHLFNLYVFSFSQLDLYMSVHQFLRWTMLQKKFLMSLMAGSEMGEDGNQLNAEQELR